MASGKRKGVVICRGGVGGGKANWGRRQALRGGQRKGDTVATV